MPMRTSFGWASGKRTWAEDSMSGAADGGQEKVSTELAKETARRDNNERVVA